MEEAGRKGKGWASLNAWLSSTCRLYVFVVTPLLHSRPPKSFNFRQPAIRMPPTVDSLNVTSATSVFLYEANRQRGLV
jgi:hypothetical protein